MQAVTAEQGEFAGWQYWPSDVFESQSAGPFFFSVDEAGPVAAFRIASHHINGGGAVHGGCLMTFADFALFAIARDALAADSGVTVSFASEFLGGAVEGERVEARGETLRAGGSLIFARGLITAEGRPCMNFSGTIKRLRAR